MLELFFLYYVLEALEKQKAGSDFCAICQKPLTPPASRRKTCSVRCRQKLSRKNKANTKAAREGG